MAAKHFYRQGFLLLLFNFISTAALEKRFSDLKRCADKECSMLLVRGKAVKDFTGPDCRFLSFKKSETIYVYYKLAGRRADLWAGSVGSSFGYFPNALLAVNHHYTDKELEVPAEETDFVCFDTGFDKFDSYDVDFLLGSSLEKSEDENKGTSDQIQVSEDAQKETQPSEEEMTGSEKQTEHQENLEDVEEDVEVPDDESASIPELESATELPSTEVVESDTTATPDFIERDADVEQKNTPEESVVENIVSEMSETKDTDTKSEVESVAKDQIVSKDESPSISEGVQIPKLKTTLGETFDAVTTDEDITKRVTPYEDEENENEEDHLKDDIDVIEKTPLLTYSEEAVTSPPPETPKQQEAPPVSDDDKPQATEEKNMWESLGDAVLSVVTGGETTQDMSSDEDEDDEEQESKEQPPFKEIKKDPEELLTTESLQEPDIMEDVHKSRESRSVQTDDKETETDVDSEALLFDDDDESEGEVVTRAEALEEASKPINDTPEIHNQTGESKISVDVVPKEETPVIPEEEKSDAKTTDEPIEHKEKEMEEVSSDSEVIVNNKVMQATVADSVVTEHRQDLDSELEENKMIADQEIVGPETETHGDLSTEQKPSKGLDVQEDERTLADKLPNQTHDHLLRDYENNTQPDLSVEEPEIHVEPHTEEVEDKKDAEVEEENVHQENEELLEDENALLSSKSEDTVSDEPSLETSSPPEPEYSDSVMRLTLLRDHFTEESMGKVQRLLGLKNLFKLEAMFTDLDIELQAARLSNTGTMQDIENALEGILEASENAILDEIEKMLDSLHKQHDYDHHVDSSSLDEETELLDDFQELAFSLRQKYSTARDSTPLVTEEPPHQDEPELIDKEEMPDIVEEKEVPITNVPETETETETEPEDNITLTRHEEKKPAETEEEKVVLDKVHTGPEVSVEEDGGYFNKNKDDQPGFSTSDEIQKVPQATLENPLDMGLGVEVENSPSGSLDSLETVSEIHEEEVGLLSTGIVYIGCIASMMNSKIIEWTTVMISLLPEEWKPGETLYGCPWEAVVITALIGVMTFTLFFWRTVLAVKKKEYLVDERRLAEQIQALKKEKDDALAKMSELQKQTEQLKENQKQSKETVSCTVKKMQELESKVLEAESRNKQMVEEKNTYAKLLENEQSKSMENESRIEKLEKSNEKLQLSRKKIQEALAKTTVLLDEAKIREDARNVQHKCLEKDYTALKEENKTLKATIKGWEDKHKELSEQIKSYQRSQKELEDSVVLKDHNVEVLSELLADLDACDAQKGDAKILANGEIAPDKKTAIKNRIKQMMDISRVQTTLTVVEEERDRFMSKLLNEEKARKALEEQHQELEHSIATLKSEKSHVENQFKILQQKNEIMVEMYQQKENALQQRLTKEELERRSKESMLSEVGGKALEAEEQVKVLRQRINEMEEQMKKTEEVYKEQIKEQENKTHSNWVNARNAERALNQEKLECSKLREKLAVLTSQLNERRAPLFRPNSGQAAGPRQGPRPPSDPHGRYAENKHIPGMDMMGPRSSSPANMDGSTQAVDPQVKADTEAEASTESPEPAPGSFLVSPIRDSPGPMVQGPPPPGPYRGPRPGPYHLPPGPPPPMHGPPLPANGHPGMPLPGPMGGEFGPRPTNGHAFHPRPGPGPVIDPRGPPPPHFRPPPPHHFGPIPPPQGIRGPVGPRPPLPPDMRFPGPRDHSSTPVDLPPGVPPHPAHPRDAYGQAPPNALHNSAGAHSGPGQDMMHVKQDAPQDSARPAMVKP